MCNFQLFSICLKIYIIHYIHMIYIWYAHIVRTQLIYNIHLVNFDSWHYFDPSHLTNYLSCSWFISLIIYQSVYLCIYQSIYLSFQLWFIIYSIYLFIYLSLLDLSILLWFLPRWKVTIMIDCITNFEDKLRTLKICTQQSIF